MKLFSRELLNVYGRQQRLDVQAAPVAIEVGAGNPPCQLMVDVACRTTTSVVVVGWCTAKDIKLQLSHKGKSSRADEIWVARPDVAHHFGLPGCNRVGFVLSSECDPRSSAAIEWSLPQSPKVSSWRLKLKNEASLTSTERRAIAPAFAALARRYACHSSEWTEWVRKTAHVPEDCGAARGFLEAAAACELTGNAVISGWAASSPGVAIWLEDDRGEMHSLEPGLRVHREDVCRALAGDLGYAGQSAGFVIRLSGIKPGDRVRLRALSERGVHDLNERECSVLPVDPGAAARWLFSLGTPLPDFSRRVELVDEPVLRPLLHHQRDSWQQLPIQAREVGASLTHPKVSVIVPIFGRFDFVEHQLIEFVDDPTFAEDAEIIYVLDDPQIVSEFAPYAESLHRIYELPFLWLWGGTNRGFSGANNLGARHARGEYLIFMNSDVFPQRPGWIDSLVNVLVQFPNVTVVGSRLLFADGSMQHSGIQFMRRKDLGVWINHHPRMGLSPSLDAHVELSLVPCVTGACMAMRRSDFEDIGGWDTGYLIGDFEDSDLCLKVRSRGGTIAYLPSAQLTHLERQSFKLLGDQHFRDRVVIFNAVRHQARWGPLLEALEAAPVEKVR